MPFVKGFYYLCLGSVCSLLIGSCANAISPTGGEKDSETPKLISENSTENLQTNIHVRKIDLKFDEWVVISDFLKEVIISPPLQYTPKMNTKGKGIRFVLDEREVLKENTTYVINFGESIKDLTEGNSFENYSFVFSTGDQLDEQKINGSIIDAFSGQVPEGAIVILHDVIQDSIVFKERPTYFSRVDEQGKFNFEYIREDTFMIFALIDLNRNYLFDGEGESIGFLDTLIYTYDTSLQNIELTLSEPIPPYRLIDFEEKIKGRIKFNTRGQDSTLVISYSPTPNREIEKIYDDSLSIFIHPADSAYTIYATSRTRIDTFHYKKKRESILPFLHLIEPKYAQISQLKPDGKISCTFNHPVTHINLSKWSVISDSINTRIPLSISKVDSAGLNWTLHIDDDRPGIHSIQILPEGITDFYNQTINDTIIFKYSSISIEDLGQISINITGLDSIQSYQCELLLKEKLVGEFYLSRTNSGKKIFNQLNPGQYDLRIIEDQNENRRWDPGDYSQKKQPEPVMKRNLEALRSNWEVQAEITWR